MLSLFKNNGFMHDVVYRRIFASHNSVCFEVINLKRNSSHFDTVSYHYTKKIRTCEYGMIC